VKDLIFIDESGVDLAMVRLYARSLKGERAKGKKPTKRGKNVSIIGAMSVNEILTSVNLIGGTDAITFEAFIIRKLVPKLWEGACVVMDNCPIHLGEEVKKASEKKGQNKYTYHLIHQIFPQLKICGQNLKSFSVLSRLLIIKN
jgi:hypothetical protein